MKIAYIAGPYRAGQGRTIDENISAARKVAEKYWRKGYAVFCPHLNSAQMDGVVPDKNFLDGDILIMKRLIRGEGDVVVAMQNWNESFGATYEVNLAEELEMEVVYDA